VCAACSSTSGPAPGAPAGTEYLFCFWNLENFYDDKPNDWGSTPDKTYDEWFASNEQVQKKKVENITSTIAGLNDGNGPDIFCAAEIESTERAVELLKEGLNARIKPGAAPYQHVLFKPLKGGRNISTAILTRLPVSADRTRLLGSRLRILEGHVDVNGHDLAVIASHWTSRVSDEKGMGRAKYGDQIYGQFRAMYTSNPKADLVICGDFNDNPTDPSVTEHLHAIGDPRKVQESGNPPLLFDLLAQPQFEGKATHVYRGKHFLFDQIVVSPGMLDRVGWWCEPDTTHIVTDKLVDSKGRPRPFGDRNHKGERGYSDHLPVTVRLKVAGK
jgi:endonuclease/exonuclease/phosphatase family metal-dependent hydrolase